MPAQLGSCAGIGLPARRPPVRLTDVCATRKPQLQTLATDPPAPLRTPRPDGPHPRRAPWPPAAPWTAGHLAPAPPRPRAPARAAARRPRPAHPHVPHPPYTPPGLLPRADDRPGYTGPGTAGR